MQLTSSDRELLIIFTRYPESGTTKTRMIPALGAEGAAKLQRQMTEHTLMQGKNLQNKIQSLSIAIYFAGGDRVLMTNWLGSDLVYHQQSEGDLGEKMKSALAESFMAGFEKVIMIGTDCPDLDRFILDRAFQQLDRNDLVLGPTEDGGYYLIGLNRLIAELFIGISWSTAEVLAQTQAIASKLHLNVSYLPILHDIDRPEDLPVWQKHDRSL